MNPEKTKEPETMESRTDAADGLEKQLAELEETLCRAEQQKDIFFLCRVNWKLAGHPRLHRLLRSMYEYEKNDPSNIPPAIEIRFRDDAAYYILPKSVVLMAFRALLAGRKKPDALLDSRPEA